MRVPHGFEATRRVRPGNSARDTETVARGQEKRPGTAMKLCKCTPLQGVWIIARTVGFAQPLLKITSALRCRTTTLRSRLASSHQCHRPITHTSFLRLLRFLSQCLSLYVFISLSLYFSLSPRFSFAVPSRKGLKRAAPISTFVSYLFLKFFMVRLYGVARRRG